MRFVRTFRKQDGRQGIREAYNEDRETEVMDIMTMLFDQETATRNYVDRVRREAAEQSLAEGLAKGLARGNVQGFVNACRNFGIPRSEALTRVARRFNLTDEDARSEVERCWGAKGAASAE
ncbi:hypothetical protein FF3_00403 [Fretibacterium fastidiosum]